MIDLSAARAALAAIASSGMPTVAVYPRGVDGAISLPAVAIGQPEIEFDTAPCTDTVTLPVAVAVELDASNLEAVQEQLESLTVQLAALLRSSLDTGALAVIGHTRALTRAEPGDWTVQGQTFPAYVLNLTIHG